MLAHDLAHPHHGHDPVPFLCLSDSNAEARVMYEAGVRYVIQSESLAVSSCHSLLSVYAACSSLSVALRCGFGDFVRS